ncbi:30S ribosome-binding factor RbfA [Phenylobacterium sp.]|jgi:ribosome-binding factor A|uniref:30S ribosome-binding factor RbfA n=1 Tax=Phenylobacterium sp. TaxID=1871053 RepID=UPI000C8B768C|nr:30S ribosome-binding factor RbfA [Phenylobacterium sp.]MAK83292.1 ribosome-binding factor A [Phenylobacterium sp.]|tara:strand:- start:10932 stop:11363 length:432 start_codon:yes stop_codon:yes gene_type:complete
MKRRPSSSRTPGARPALRGPSQRQLRAGELVRHALVEIMREEDLDDPALSGAPVTITEVRVSPDLRHAVCFIQPLGGENAPEVVAAMNRASKFFRGRLGRMIDLRATPELKFLHDETFDAADKMGRLFDDPKVRQDLDAPEED